ncbi:YciI-like protein [Alkalimonas amylolytica]|uniref:YCII-related domain-containing protein n=1 Tax=Alkalimonas amylolytica TaxID=152573 RepID=A0A1H4DXR7_ALKAM|nr:YciI-like protein [Alkalimonas amylolytica]SEA77551.1 hypothetical protein SAMN04488051_10699 [Alkalimonas amylolytica]
MHYLLFYHDLVDDYVQRREAWRGQHLAYAKAAHARGDLILAGALADPVDGAVLLFQGDSPAVAERFAEQDPYVRHGLVGRWEVRPWSTVVGDMAIIRPN